MWLAESGLDVMDVLERSPAGLIAKLEAPRCNQCILSRSVEHRCYGRKNRYRIRRAVEGSCIGFRKLLVLGHQTSAGRASFQNDSHTANR